VSPYAWSLRYSCLRTLSSASLANFMTWNGSWTNSSSALLCQRDAPLGTLHVGRTHVHGHFHHLCHLQVFKGVTFKEQRESTMRFCSGNAHGAKAMLGTVHSCDGGNGDLLELAGIQMSPLAFLPMIVTGERSYGHSGQQNRVPRGCSTWTRFS
jgi:hypothetical protein